MCKITIEEFLPKSCDFSHLVRFNAMTLITIKDVGNQHYHEICIRVRLNGSMNIFPHTGQQKRIQKKKKTKVKSFINHTKLQLHPNQ